MDHSYSIDTCLYNNDGDDLIEEPNHFDTSEFGDRLNTLKKLMEEELGVFNSFKDNPELIDDTKFTFLKKCVEGLSKFKLSDRVSFFKEYFEKKNEFPYSFNSSIDSNNIDDSKSSERRNISQISTAPFTTNEFSTTNEDESETDLISDDTDVIEILRKANSTPNGSPEQKLDAEILEKVVLAFLENTDKFAKRAIDENRHIFADKLICNLFNKLKDLYDKDSKEKYDKFLDSQGQYPLFNLNLNLPLKAPNSVRQKIQEMSKNPLYENNLAERIFIFNLLVRFNMSEIVELCYDFTQPLIHELWYLTFDIIVHNRDHDLDALYKCRNDNSVVMKREDTTEYKELPSLEYGNNIDESILDPELLQILKENQNDLDDNYDEHNISTSDSTDTDSDEDQNTIGQDLSNLNNDFVHNGLALGHSSLVFDNKGSVHYQKGNTPEGPVLNLNMVKVVKIDSSRRSRMGSGRWSVSMTDRGSSRDQWAKGLHIGSWEALKYILRTNRLCNGDRIELFKDHFNVKRNKGTIPWVEEPHNHLQTYYLVDKNCVTIKVRGKLPCDVMTVLAIITETELAPKWVPFLKDSKDLHSYSRTSRIFKQAFDYPVIGHKESLVYGLSTNVLDEANCVIITCSNPPSNKKEADSLIKILKNGGLNNTNKFINVDGKNNCTISGYTVNKIPKRQNQKSGDICFLLFPYSDNQTIMEVYGNVVPEVKIVPLKFVTILIKKVILGMFKKIVFILKGLDETEFVELIKNRYDFYRWMLDIYQEYKLNHPRSFKCDRVLNMYTYNPSIESKGSN